MIKKILSVAIVIAMCISSVFCSGSVANALVCNVTNVPSTVCVGLGEKVTYPIEFKNTNKITMSISNSGLVSNVGGKISNSFNNPTTYGVSKSSKPQTLNYLLRGDKVGNGTLYVSDPKSLVSGDYHATKVYVYKAPSKISLSTTSKTMGVGESFILSEYTDDGSYANSANLIWSTSNKKVVTVSKINGTGQATVVANGTGTATITVKTYNGKTAKCKITVKNAPKSVYIGDSNGSTKYSGFCKQVTISKGSTVLMAAHTPGGYCNKSGYTWSTTNSNISTKLYGTNKIYVTGNKKGTSYLKVKTYNGKSVSLKIVVK